MSSPVHPKLALVVVIALVVDLTHLVTKSLLYKPVFFFYKQICSKIGIHPETLERLDFRLASSRLTAALS